MTSLEGLKLFSQLKHEFNPYTAKHKYGRYWDLILLKHVCDRHPNQQPIALGAFTTMLLRVSPVAGRYYLTRVDAQTRSQLLIALVNKNRPDLVRFLIQYGADMETRAEKPWLLEWEHKYPLRDAWDMPIVRLLLTMGAHPRPLDEMKGERLPDRRSWTRFRSGNNLRFLLGAGSQITPHNVVRALWDMSLDDLHLLVEFGGDVNWIVPSAFVCWNPPDRPMTIFEYLFVELHMKKDTAKIIDMVIDHVDFGKISLIRYGLIGERIRNIWDKLDNHTHDVLNQVPWMSTPR